MASPLLPKSDSSPVPHLSYLINHKVTLIAGSDSFLCPNTAVHISLIFIPGHCKCLPSTPIHSLPCSQTIKCEYKITLLKTFYWFPAALRMLNKICKDPSQPQFLPLPAPILHLQILPNCQQFPEYQLSSHLRLFHLLAWNAPLSAKLIFVIQISIWM